MAKIVDITEKLNFEGRPRIVIKGVELEVNDRAANVLKIMQLVSNGNSGPSEIIGMYETLFSKEDRKKIDALDLGMDDFTQVVMSAAQLVTGEYDGTGER